MSRCLNKATLIGYLGADPEIRTISSGARVAQFSVGTTRKWEGRDGKPYDLMLAAERVRHSVGAMQALLADPDCNEPRSIAEFPIVAAERRRDCQFCPFYTLCEQELQKADLIS
jgi:single-stranded DNA-binding protein